jgi:dihydrodipicolinate synthase/N-acetylneuraminate lyase
VLPLGGTGEYGALSRSERVRMVEVTAQEAAGRVPVIAGVLDPGYHDAIQPAKDFAAAGADALLVLTPYYTNPTQAGIRDYFLRYADQSPVPGPMKSVMDMIGVNAPDMLAPLVRADAALEQNLRAELAKQLETFERRR